MIRPRLRRGWLVLHRWVGLSMGLILLVAAFTGTLLVIARPFDEALHPGLFRARTEGLGQLQPVVERMRAEFGPSAAFNLRLPSRAGESLQVGVSGVWNGTVYVDPGTGSETGRRAAGEGFFNILFELHSTLFAADWGGAVLAVAALAYGLMLTSGLVLWWPSRWKHAFAVRRGATATLTLFDLHRAGGVALGLLVLVSVSTGAYMAWRPLATWVSALAQAAPRAPVQITTFGAARSIESIDAAARAAAGHWPGGKVSVLHVPPRAITASRARLRLPDDPHPVGMSTVYFIPTHAGVQTAKHWSELDAGTRAFSVIYPLHTGALYGTATLLATAAGGIALTFMGGTGASLWWRRRVNANWREQGPS